MNAWQEEQALNAKPEKLEKSVWEDLDKTLQEQKKFSDWLDSYINAIGKDNIQKVSSFKNGKELIIWDSYQA